jgi:hypothetical protein
MKKSIFKLILITLFLVASAAVPASADLGGGYPPLCYPKACPLSGTSLHEQFSGGQPPFCIPGRPECPVS